MDREEYQNWYRKNVRVPKLYAEGKVKPRPPKVVRPCPYCGKEIKTRPSDKRKFCDQECAKSFRLQEAVTKTKKRCNGCGQWKDKEEFDYRKLKNGKTVLKSRCKKCYKEERKKYEFENIDRVRKIRRKSQIKYNSLKEIRKQISDVLDELEQEGAI